MKPYAHDEEQYGEDDLRGGNPPEVFFEAGQIAEIELQIDNHSVLLGGEDNQFCERKDKLYFRAMKKSAGILLFQKAEEGLLFFLAHPGGPFWKNKDMGAWSVPKGEFEEEEPLAAALREFEEETGVLLPGGDFLELSPVKMKSGKMIYAWALEHYVDPAIVVSNEFELEWPPRSGKHISVPEIDRAAWFSEQEALEKIIEAQQGFIRELAAHLGS